MTARWITRGGVEITRDTEAIDVTTARAALEDALDHRRGLLLCSGYEYPGRYRIWSVGYVDPPLEIVGCGPTLTARALNARGRVLLPVVREAWRGLLEPRRCGPGEVSGTVPAADGLFAEEERTRRPSVFGALRALIGRLAAPDDRLLGLYGAFGYDLAFQFDPVPLRHARARDARDLVVHLPDALTEIDPVRGTAVQHSYEFTVGGVSTRGLPRITPAERFGGGRQPGQERDHRPGEYAALVRLARDRFRAGQLYEVVPGQCFQRRCAAPPSILFRRLAQRNPAPYGLLANLGAGEFLVGASPEMFVRVTPPTGPAGPAGGAGSAAGTGSAAGRRLRLETCPISGTIVRGGDALEDAELIRRLLNSAKDESELTMCTDVDRNDKARVCEAGSVKVIGRRQLELYATLIHTVDHVEGVLRPDRDALDAFLTHMWAVTVTGAPKRAAIRFIEDHERSPRRWYGGAVGRIGFDGGLDTALTLRTIQIRDGVATVRAGATLLHDSDPDAEEQETMLKARALLETLDAAGQHPGSGTAGAAGTAGTAGTTGPAATAGAAGTEATARGSRFGSSSLTAAAARHSANGTRSPRDGLTVLLVDHEDSFVHTLADYFRQAGADVVTYRSGFAESLLDALRPGLMVLSPGPGRPEDFCVGQTLAGAQRRGIPVFGVCLGLQGMVQHLGGKLRVLDPPVHGKPSRVRLIGTGGRVLAGLPSAFQVGRYHSLHADPATLPPELTVTARAEGGVVMAIEHRRLPWAAVQFHPESILSQRDRCGHLVIANAVARLGRPPRPANQPPPVRTRELPPPAGRRGKETTRAGGTA